jgi:hypothetical protein
MPVKSPRREKHFSPKLNKRYVLTCEGYDVYAVDPFAVRNYAEPDEEFDNFATRDEFPNLIPKGEIWLAHQTLESEGVFFIANAVARLKELARGASEDRAYDAGIKVDRALREQHNHVKFRDGRPHRRVPPEIYTRHYITLADREFSIDAWLIDGNMARSWYKTDYTEGGHGYVYRWVPKNEIWIEKDLHPAEIPFILAHEYLELRLMRDRGVEYDPAHAICSKMEFALRKGRGVKRLLAPGRARFRKRHVPGLTADDVFEFVVKHYLDK